MYHETQGCLFMPESLRQLADNILANHRHFHPVERCRLDSVAIVLTVIQIRLDEWLRQLDKPAARDLLDCSHILTHFILEIDEYGPNYILPLTLADQLHLLYEVFKEAEG
jgi:hypothetical protein